MFPQELKEKVHQELAGDKTNFTIRKFSGKSYSLIIITLPVQSKVEYQQQALQQLV